MAPSWPILDATCCQLGPNFAHPALIFAPVCGEIHRKSRPGRQRAPPDLPGPRQDQIFESMAPARHPKIPKKLSFLLVVGFLLSSPCAKILPKCSHHAPKTSQVEPKIANLALSWPAPTSPILRPFSRQHAQKFQENRAQDAKNRSKIPQDDSRSQFCDFSSLEPHFSWFATLPDLS